MPGKEKAILADLDLVFFGGVDHFGEYGVSPRLEEEIKVVEGLTKSLDELVRLGFIIIGHTNHTASDLRLFGYRRALDRAGNKFEPKYVR